MQQVIAIFGENNEDVKVEVMGEENLDLFPIPATRDELDQSFRIGKRNFQFKILLLDGATIKRKFLTS